MAIHVAIIGYGTVSKAHIEALNSIPNVIVSDIYSSHLDPLEAEKVSHTYRVTVHSDLNNVLDDPKISIVSICSRPDLHAIQAIAAAKAGKHIILEKPIALNLQDCLKVQKAVEQAGVMMSVCFECRYSDQFLKSKSIVDSKLGRITYCSISYCHGIGLDNPQFSWNTKIASGGSSLLSAGCHALDAVMFMMGDVQVEEVTSYSSTINHARYRLYEYPPHQVTILKFKNGSIGHVISSIACTQPYDFPTYIIGTDGTLKDNLIYIQENQSASQKEWETIPMALLKSGAVDDHPYLAQFTDFINDITTCNYSASTTKLNAAMQSHRVIFAADLSAKLQQSIKIDRIDSLLLNSNSDKAQSAMSVSKL